MTPAQITKAAMYQKVKVSYKRLQTLSLQWDYLHHLADGEKTQTDLILLTRKSQCVVHQQMEHLINTKVVKKRTVGRFVYYSLIEAELYDITVCIKKLINY